MGILKSYKAQRQLIFNLNINNGTDNILYILSCLPSSHAKTALQVRALLLWKQN